MMIFIVLSPSTRCNYVLNLRVFILYKLCSHQS